MTTCAAVKLLGAKDATVDTAKITDYGDIPTKYAAAVGQVYATGLIKGDNAGNVNDTNTMTRAEAATVMDRLIALKANLETPEEEIPPRTGEMVTVEFKGHINANRSTVGIEGKPEGAQVIFIIDEGRELGRVVTDVDGKYTIKFEMDRADDSLTSTDKYHVEVYYTAPDGEKFSNVHKSGAANTSFNFDFPGALYRSSQTFTVYNDSFTFTDFSAN